MSSSLSDSVNGAHPTATPPASPAPRRKGLWPSALSPPTWTLKIQKALLSLHLGQRYRTEGTGWVGRGSWGPGRSGGCDPSRVGRSRQMPQMGLARQGTEG